MGHLPNSPSSSEPSVGLKKREKNARRIILLNGAMKRKNEPVGNQFPSHLEVYTGITTRGPRSTFSNCWIAAGLLSCFIHSSLQPRSYYSTWITMTGIIIPSPACTYSLILMRRKAPNRRRIPNFVFSNSLSFSGLSHVPINSITDPLNLMFLLLLRSLVKIVLAACVVLLYVPNDVPRF